MRSPWNPVLKVKYTLKQVQGDNSTQDKDCISRFARFDTGIKFLPINAGFRVVLFGMLFEIQNIV